MRLRTSRSCGRGTSSLYSGAARWLLVVCAAAAIGPALAGRSLQQTQSPAGSKGGQPFTPTKPSVKRYEWTISYTKAAPDCFEKNVVVVNGKFQPTIRVKRGQILEVHIKNDLPPDYPSSTNGGVTIHWHGFSQRDEPWQDGVAYVQQCPILPGEEFTYRFLVTDSPGTYFWHDHASGNHADGLSGFLIVEPEDGVPALDQYDEERTVYLHDWFHTQGDVLGMSLNRPLDPALQNSSTGAWEWVNVPQAVLINQRGSFYDCPLGPPQTPAVTPTCAVNNYTIPAGLAGQPMASASNPGCSHASLTVQQNKTYLIRIVNAGTLNMESLCFQGHNVTIVAADATPVEPLEVECVDVNLGQRYDVLLKTDQPVANYWMRSASQYRAGSPDGYGVLHYEGAPNNTLPDAQLPQPGSTPPFLISTINSLKSRGVLFNPQAAQNVSFLWPGNQTTLAVPNASRGFKLGISQPLLNQTGQLRWGINNIVHAETPTCSALLEEVVDNPDFVEENLPNANGFGNGALGTQNSGDVAGGQNLYTNYTFPMTPMAGRHLIQIAQGEVIDIVIQNHEASDLNGAGRLPKRNGSEQHPFHLHGQHFWLLGTGEGTYDPANATLNTMNPMYRDTATVPPYGWVVFRFLADNPGLWLLHCHVYWHQYMGQTVAFAVSPDKVKQPPKNLPKCPKTCPAQFAPWRPSYVQKTYGRLPYEIPLNTVG